MHKHGTARKKCLSVFYLLYCVWAHCFFVFLLFNICQPWNNYALVATLWEGFTGQIKDELADWDLHTSLNDLITLATCIDIRLTERQCESKKSWGISSHLHLLHGKNPCKKRDSKSPWRNIPTNAATTCVLTVGPKTFSYVTVLLDCTIPAERVHGRGELKRRILLPIHYNVGHPDYPVLI